MRKRRLACCHSDQGGGGPEEEDGIRHNAVAGPSRLRDLDMDVCMACEARRSSRSTTSSTSTILAESESIAGDTHRQQRPRRRKLPASLLYLPFLAPTFTAAAPPPARPPPSPPNRIKPRSQPHLVYPTSVATPADLPTEVYTVEETALPYYLRKNADGRWEKVDNAWRLYGRQPGPVEGVLVTDENPSFVVEESLPKGWGQSSSRTAIYRVPLIVVASVILALAIVVGIIVIVFKRRKAHRKAKRKAERARRKALAAAGLDENGINGSTAEVAFKEKLADLERQHRAKKRKEGNVVFAKVKVKKWTNGLRRRKGKEDGQTPTIEIVREEEDEVKPIETEGPNGIRSSSPNLDSISDVMAGDTTDGPTSRESSPNISPENTTSEDSHQAVQGSSSAAPYFPPAYRPASVRSYALDESSGSSTSRHAQVDPPPSADGPVLGVEKTRAPGYYPAPATEDGEAALEVVSRAEGKSRMPVQTDPMEEEEQERIRHIATDDKRVLERMRLGASAPPSAPVPSSEDSPQDLDGPSAPRVELDQDGFERADELDELPSPPLSTPITPLHPDIPVPPRPTAHRSYLGPVISTASDPVLNELHLLPSAPPVSHPGEPSAPFAPLMGENEDATPSAPPLSFDIGEEETDEGIQETEELRPSHAEGSAVGHDVSADGGEAREGGEVGEEGAGGSEHGSGGSESAPRPRVFLPKYEP